MVFIGSMDIKPGSKLCLKREDTEPSKEMKLQGGKNKNNDKCDSFLDKL